MTTQMLQNLSRLHQGGQRYVGLSLAIAVLNEKLETAARIAEEHGDEEAARRILALREPAP